MATVSGVVVEIEPFRPDEAGYEERVDVCRDVQPNEPWNVPQERWFDRSDDEAGRASGTLMARIDGRAVGMARFRELAMYPAPGRRDLWLGVREEARGRGVGSALLGTAESVAAEGDATELLVNLSTTEPESVDFFGRRGFEEIEREWEMHLDLRSVIPETKRVSNDLEIVTLVEYRLRDPEWMERLWRLFDRIQATIPSAVEYKGMSLDDFRRISVESPGVIPEAFFVGLLDGSPVALTTLWRNAEDETTVYQDLTGVLPEHRRKGFAIAVKLRGIDWARSAGFLRILTGSSSLNTPMVTLNEVLGFRKATGWSLRRKYLP
jgi:GNAT superfamily N-acetyltransferase